MAKSKVGLVGGGSWATAIAKMLVHNYETINWWVRNEYKLGHLQKRGHNADYLSSVKFNPEQLNLTTDINKLVEDSDWIILAVPSIYVEQCLENLTVSIQNKLIVSAIKGIVPGHFQLISSYLHDKYGMDYDDFGVISGPCHAEEVALERLSYLTIAAQNKDKAKLVAESLARSFIKVNLTDDIFGTEYSSVLKNIYAISSGIAHGLGYGDNFQAVLMSNAIREMHAVMQHISPIERNVMDSAYLGDLLVTGYSNFSRNRMFGNMIGKGYTVKSAILEMNMVAEGYYAAKSISRLLKEEKIKAPIVEAVSKVLHEHKPAKEIFQKLAKKLN